MTNGLQAEFRVAAGRLDLRIAFRLTASWSILFGASGSGKTTVLQVLAGLRLPAQGTIALTRKGEARVWCDTTQGILLPARRRGARIALQQAWLFPGTVRSNVGFGVAAARRKQGVDQVLERFRLADRAATDVRELSGGERQRVSLARAAAGAVYGERPCALLLLDEPFNGMDLALRDRLALELRDWLRERKLMVLSVTHDVGEAFLLEAEVARLDAGRIVAQGPAAEVLREERERLLGVLSQEAPLDDR